MCIGRRFSWQARGSLVEIQIQRYNSWLLAHLLLSISSTHTPFASPLCHPICALSFTSYHFRIPDRAHEWEQRSDPLLVVGLVFFWAHCFFLLHFVLFPALIEISLVVQAIQKTCTFSFLRLLLTPLMVCLISVSCPFPISSPRCTALTQSFL